MVIRSGILVLLLGGLFTGLSPRDVAAQDFIRGDSNADGSVATLSDALFTLSFGFSGGPQPPCVDAADFDDDGVFSALVDALGLLQFAFTGGAPPPPPGAVCGADLTNDALDCLNYAACP